MKKTSITKNYIYNVLYQILAIIIPIITTPYLARVLGAEKIGIYGYTVAISSFFILFGANGIIVHGKREIAYNQDNEIERSKIFYEIFIIRIIILIISLVIYYPWFCVYGEYSFYFKILLLEIIANTLDISWFFQGLEEFKKTVTRNMIVKIISVICIFIFIKNQKDLYKYFIIYSGSILLGNLTLWLYLPNFIKKVELKHLNFKRHIKPIIELMIPQIATQVYLLLDKTMIGIISPTKIEVGYYEQAQKITNLLLTIATSLGTVMMPRIAASYSKGNNKKIAEYMKKSFQYLMFLCFPMTLGLISISNAFIPIFLGNEFNKSIPVLCIISPIIVLVGLSNVVGIQYLLPTKQQRKYTLSVITGAIINFTLNYILIRYYDSIGAAIATVFAELSVTTVQFILVRNEIKFLDVVRSTYQYFIASIIMFVFSIFIGIIIDNNYLSLILQIIISISVYLGVLFIMKDEFLIYNYKKIRKKFKIKEK